MRLLETSESFEVARLTFVGADRDRSCEGPRAREDSVRPRRPAGVVVRPLNFTVRFACTALPDFDPAGCGGRLGA